MVFSERILEAGFEVRLPAEEAHLFTVGAGREIGEEDEASGKGAVAHSVGKL